ncbi:TPA: hypothetical protein U2C09_000357 [Streptococcus suis]|nr:hypothetical protein [Streptococcus suis]
MLKDEFKRLPRETLSFGRSPKEEFIAIPQSIFDLPPEEKELALKELETELERY